MKLQKVLAGVLLSSAALAAHATLVTYATEALFLSAAGSGLSFQGFESVTTPTNTSVAFTGGSFTCAGSNFCPGFFGVSGLSLEGSQSVFFASPDSATFTFATPITAFSIFIGGAGDVAPITLTASTSAGSATVLSNYSNANSTFAGNSQFFGVTSNTAFTSITFTPSNSADGIFFDAMRFGTTAAVIPTPGTLALVGLGGLGLALSRRRKA